VAGGAIILAQRAIAALQERRGVELHTPYGGTLPPCMLCIGWYGPLTRRHVFAAWEAACRGCVCSNFGMRPPLPSTPHTDGFCPLQATRLRGARM
jgi:hypothetical protein